MKVLSQIALVIALAASACSDVELADVEQHTCISNPPAVFNDPLGFHPNVTLQAPDNYATSCDTPRPLVLLLHGYNETGPGVQTYFQFGNLKNIPPDGALVLAPSGNSWFDGTSNPRYWNASLACCDRGHIGNDDVAYLGGLVDRAIVAGWNVDPARIYIVGRSNGGFMAERLACDRADLFAAIVDQSGADGSVDDPACLTPGPVNVLYDKGEKDETVLYIGGTMSLMTSPYRSAVDSLAANAARNGCTGTLDLITAHAFNHDLAIDGFETDLFEQSGCPTDGALTFWHQLKSKHKPRLNTTWPTDVWAWLLAHHR